MVKINYTKPNKCSECIFIGTYTTGPFTKYPHYCCEMIWQLEHEDYRVNPHKIDENCPLIEID